MKRLPSIGVHASLHFHKPANETKTFDDIDIFFKHSDEQKIDYKKLRKITEDISIRQAAEEWLNTQRNQETRRKYKLGLDKIFLADPTKNLGLSFDEPINALDASEATVGIYEYILEYWQEPKTMRQLCATTYGQLCDFVRTKTHGWIDPDLLPREKKAYQKALEIYPKVDWEKFINTVGYPFNVLAELVYLTAVQSAYRLKISDTKQNVLTLSTDQIHFESNTICYRRGQTYHSIELCIFYPKTFMDRLQEYLQEAVGLVFTNNAGGILFPKQVERALKRASEKLGLSFIISPNSLAWAGTIKNAESFQKNKLKKSS
jgi:hypothetical protein